MAESSSDHDDEEHQEPPPPPPPRRRGRGPTKLAQVLSQPAEHHQRNHLHLDEFGRPTRQLQSHSLASLVHWRGIE